MAVVKLVCEREEHRSSSAAEKGSWVLGCPPLPKPCRIQRALKEGFLVESELHSCGLESGEGNSNLTNFGYWKIKAFVACF